MSELTQKQRKSIIRTLSNNCECWKGEDEFLDSFDDSKLLTMADGQKAIGIANEAIEGFTHDDRQYRFNPDEEEWQMMSVENEDDDFDLDLVDNPAGKGYPKDMDEEENEDEDEDEDEEEPVASKGKKKMAKNQFNINSGVRWKNFNEWYSDPSSAPKEVKTAVTNAMKMERAQKVRRVQLLTNHIEDDDDRNSTAKMLMNKSLEELNVLMKLARPTTNEVDFQIPDFFGASGGPVSRLTENEQMDILDIDEARKSYDPKILNQAKAS